MSKLRVQIAFLATCFFALLATSHLAFAVNSASAVTPGDVCTFKFDAQGKITPPSQGKVFDTHQSNEILRKYDKNCDGKLEPDEYAEYMAAQAVPRMREASLAPATQSPAARAKPLIAKATAPSAAAKGCPLGWSVAPFLRNSYSDLSFFDTSTCATDLSKVKGATFSWSYDGIAKNNQWLAEGVAGARFLYLEQTPGTGEPYVNYIAIAPLVQFQRVTNSSPKQAKSNIDVLSPGVSSEAFIDQLTPNSQMYLRLRGNANGDFEGNVHSWSSTAEIQPFIYPYFGNNHPIPYIGYWAIFPLARVQYFERVNNSVDPLFGTSNSVLRGGPAVTFNFWPLDDPSVPAIIRSTLLTISYSWYQDFLHPRTFSLLESTLQFNITDNVGVALKNQYGQIETTGQNVNLTTAGLTLKF